MIARVEIWNPRFRKFKPPKWFIFRWAYNVSLKELSGYEMNILEHLPGVKIFIDENGFRNMKSFVVKIETWK